MGYYLDHHGYADGSAFSDTTDDITIFGNTLHGIGLYTKTDGTTHDVGGVTLAQRASATENCPSDRIMEAIDFSKRVCGFRSYRQAYGNLSAIRMYDPQFGITPAIASNLVRIARLAADLRYLTISPALLHGMRETAKIHTVHCSTVIEGNLLTVAEVQTVIHDAKAKPGQTRDEAEVRGYTLALNRIADWIEADAEITEERIRTILALVSRFMSPADARGP